MGSCNSLEPQLQTFREEIRTEFREEYTRRYNAFSCTFREEFRAEFREEFRKEFRAEFCKELDEKIYTQTVNKIKGDLDSVIRPKSTELISNMETKHKNYIELMKQQAVPFHNEIEIMKNDFTKEIDKIKGMLNTIEVCSAQLRTLDEPVKFYVDGEIFTCLPEAIEKSGMLLAMVNTDVGITMKDDAYVLNVPKKCIQMIFDTLYIVGTTNVEHICFPSELIGSTNLIYMFLSTWKYLACSAKFTVSLDFINKHLYIYLENHDAFNNVKQTFTQMKNLFDNELIQIDNIQQVMKYISNNNVNCNFWLKKIIKYQTRNNAYANGIYTYYNIVFYYITVNETNVIIDKYDEYKKDETQTVSKNLFYEKCKDDILKYYTKERFTYYML